MKKLDINIGKRLKFYLLRREEKTRNFDISTRKANEKVFGFEKKIEK